MCHNKANNIIKQKYRHPLCLRAFDKVGLEGVCLKLIHLSLTKTLIWAISFEELLMHNQYLVYIYIYYDPCENSFPMAPHNNLDL